MLASLLIVFREVIEAGLIVGIVLAATKGVAGRGRWVSLGIAAGVLLAEAHPDAATHPSRFLRRRRPARPADRLRTGT